MLQPTPDRPPKDEAASDEPTGQHRAETPARPSVSVVIPVKNDAGPLTRCLTALAAQTVPPVEVLVVDNGSEDGSADVARRLGARVLHESTPGIAAAASAGYDAARGDVIGRIDTDTVVPADWVERVADAFAADPRLAALSGPGRFGDLPGAVDRALPGLSAWYNRVYFGRVGERAGVVPLFGSNLALRGTAWRQVRDRVDRRARARHDDLDLSLHLAEAGLPTAVDPRLVVTISARPLRHPVGMLIRAARAATTLAAHPRSRRPRGEPHAQHRAPADRAVSR